MLGLADSKSEGRGERGHRSWVSRPSGGIQHAVRITVPQRPRHAYGELGLAHAACPDHSDDEGCPTPPAGHSQHGSQLFQFGCAIHERFNGRRQHLGSELGCVPSATGRPRIPRDHEIGRIAVDQEYRPLRDGLTSEAIGDVPAELGDIDNAIAIKISLAALNTVGHPAGEVPT